MIQRLALALVCFSSLVATSPRQVVAPPVSLAVEGAPAIQSAPKDEKMISLYAESREASLVNWSQRGRTMLIRMVSPKRTARQLVELPAPMGKTRPEGDLDGETSFGPWQPTGKSMLVIQKDVDGNELRQIYTRDPATHSLTLLSDGKSANSYPVWSPGGNRIAFCTVHRDSNTAGICTVDPTDPSTLKEIAQLPMGNWDNVNDWSPDGKYLLVVSGDMTTASRILLVDAISGEKTEITPPEKAAYYMPIGFMADGRGILLATDLGGEFRRLAHMDLASKSVSFLTPDTWDVDSYMVGQYDWPALSADRRWLAFAINRNGLSTLHLLDVEKKEVRDLPCPGSGQVRNLHWHGNNREFAFNLVSNQTLGDIFSFNIQTGKTERWTKLGPYGLDLTRNSIPSLVKWKSFDQREISGWLYRPPTTFKGKRPVMISIHGGPTDQFLPSQLAENNYFINDLGMALVFPNIRGSSGYGKTFLDLDNGSHREDACKDIETLLDWIAQEPTLDPSRIMISGHSYGGYMSFTLATKVGERVACFIASSGMSNLANMEVGSTAELAAVDTQEFGDLQDPKALAFLTSISPLTHANQIKRPLLVVAGKNDPRVPIGQSDTMVAALRAQGTPVWYLRAANEGHNFQHKDNRKYQMLVTIAFIKKYLIKNK